MGLNSNPLVGVAPCMEGASHDSTDTITTFAEALEESNKSEPKDGIVAHVEDHISSNGDQFDG
jgi:hypothetical protein